MFTMRDIFFLAISLNAFLFSGVSLAATPGSQDIEFNVILPKNTCDITVSGTSQNVVDFGSLALSRLKSDSAVGNVKLPFSIKLTNCKTNDFVNNYVMIDGNYSAANNGFLDEVGEKTFAIRISDKDSAKQSDNVFFDKVKNKIWTNIPGNNSEKTFYAYLMCKDGVLDCSSDANIGQFKSTFTLTYMVD